MPAAAAPAEEVRGRVMAGMVMAVEEKGYAATTVADIAKAARISRRTLYEHFADKEACFLAAYSMMSDTLITQVVTAARSVPAGLERVHAATAAYFQALGDQPEVARAFLTEINAVGPAGLELRVKVNQRFASMMADLVAESVGQPGDQLPDGRYARPFDDNMASALVGGINELVLQAIVTGPPDTLTVRLGRLTAPVIELAERLLLSETPA
ncbi:MAG: TetR/AcrR family transcriptional regulator [Solirubrobacteraceae bacterium]|nr:TetR/AcrR family transcriptional regulator [Solirubrobacteraceae bacterium]